MQGYVLEGLLDACVCALGLIDVLLVNMWKIASCSFASGAERLPRTCNDLLPGLKRLPRT